MISKDPIKRILHSYTVMIDMQRVGVVRPPELNTLLLVIVLVKRHPWTHRHRSIHTRSLEFWSSPMNNCEIILQSLGPFAPGSIPALTTDSFSRFALNEGEKYLSPGVMIENVQVTKAHGELVFRPDDIPLRGRKLAIQDRVPDPCDDARWVREAEMADLQSYDRDAVVLPRS